ncbi:hypothetical protein [Candidatus Absconditicoccus praedator]|uniref:hypothetical protein n=1 Tax=Candidatus Absconditicoccus praedator TaxID=2735562 RepID=UPI001E5A3090|nr:hypothetical protein [Candidatus Absconditicoccus praedator]UFX83189.1 hypothetical protein HLG78_03600 [Candidatus Absconditicoccus praedator]
MFLLNKLILFCFVLAFSLLSFSYAEGGDGDQGPVKRGSRDASPNDVLDQVREGRGVQDTQLDHVQRQPGGSVEGTLDGVRMEIGTYINWAVFIGLSIAVILIIYNGLLLVTTSMNESVLEKVKTRLMYLGVGVLIMTGFYVIIQLVMSLLANIT